MNPYQKQKNQYLQTQVGTASKEQLVLMLMDGVIRFSEQGRKAIEDKDIEKKQFSLVRSQDIIIELVNGLDHEQGGDIATNLARLYSYSIKRLVDANLQDDPAGIDEVQHIFRNLREAWAVAMDTAAKENATSAPSPVEHTKEYVAPSPRVAQPVHPPTDDGERPRLSVQG